MDQSEKIAFAAGVIESGSYIGILALGKNKWVPVVRVRRNRPDMINFLHEHFGGYRGVTGVGDKTRYWISFQGKKAIDFLRQLYMCLQVKKKHVEIIFDLEASIIRCKKMKKKPFEPIPEMEARLRTGCKMNLQSLNKHNVDPETENIFG